MIMGVALETTSYFGLLAAAKDDPLSRRALLFERRVGGVFGALYGRRRTMRSLGARRRPGGGLALDIGRRDDGEGGAVILTMRLSRRGEEVSLEVSFSVSHHPEAALALIDYHGQGH